jgi:hypothetical protein
MRPFFKVLDLPDARIVLLDWSNDKSYRYENLFCYNLDGSLKWKGHLPENTGPDVFVGIRLDDRELMAISKELARRHAGLPLRVTGRRHDYVGIVIDAPRIADAILHEVGRVGPTADNPNIYSPPSLRVSRSFMWLLAKLSEKRASSVVTK